MKNIYILRVGDSYRIRVTGERQLPGVDYHWYCGIKHLHRINPLIKRHAETYDGSDRWISAAPPLELFTVSMKAVVTVRAPAKSGALQMAWFKHGRFLIDDVYHVIDKCVRTDRRIEQMMAIFNRYDRLNDIVGVNAYIESKDAPDTLMSVDCVRAADGKYYVTILSD